MSETKEIACDDGCLVLLSRSPSVSDYHFVVPFSVGEDEASFSMTRDQLIDAAIVFLKVANVTEWMVDRTPRGPGHPR